MRREDLDQDQVPEEGQEVVQEVVGGHHQVMGGIGQGHQEEDLAATREG